jgi:hypothetical protein
MTDPSVARVLLALRVRGVVEGPAVAERVGLPVDEVVEVLRSCAAAGWVLRSEGRLPGWGLTAAGRRHGEHLLEVEVAAGGLRAPIESAYRRFLPLNAELLSICTDWQVLRVDGVEVPNDHGDAERDAWVLARLAGLHADASHLTRSLGDLLDRFAGYHPRLDAAHRRVASGAHEWLTRPTIDSYHTVWFELHEDLLATLGRTRSDERTTARVAGATPAAPAERSAAHEEYA